MSKKSKSTRLFYTDEVHLKMYESVPEKDFKELFVQALSYKYGDKAEPKFSNPMTMAVWMMMKKEIDFNEEKWANKAEASRENGKKGGRPKKHDAIDEFEIPQDFDMNFSNVVELEL